MEKTLAIIGTADKSRCLTKQDFVRMYNHAKDYVKSHHVTALVSGGAGWSDHVAVKLFLRKKVTSLTLCLPCDFDTTTKQYVDTGSDDWKTNPGRLANRYHQYFTVKRERSSLEEIAKAITKGAIIKVYKGFHKRNDIVAKENDLLIAYGLGDEPEGGTKYTFDKCHHSKEFFNIRKL
jgi:hypothetical protein